jgi:hypothetical protein
LSLKPFVHSQPEPCPALEAKMPTWWTGFLGVYSWAWNKAILVTIPFNKMLEAGPSS